MAGPQERLETELSLLEAMYPEQTIWDANARELRYSSDANSFQLRLPDSYPDADLPQVLSATVRRSDVREQMKKHISSCNPGEEILDSIVLAFHELSESSTTDGGDIDHTDISTNAEPDVNRKLTIIVWLHHLLNTNKRKQALSPSSQDVRGVTKPGYPGVLVYSGPSEAVREHVNELRQLNWQAFQVRLESEEVWTFLHGAGVKEVESMKDVVAELDREKREAFMEAMRMK